MIKNYGLFWKKEHVFWGKKNNPGSLLGARSRSIKARSVDFRDQRGIYALYADYELVYLGQAGSGQRRMFARIKEHLDDHLVERWNRFSWFGTQWVTADGLSADTSVIGDSVNIVLNKLEAVTIAIAEPNLNLQRGRWGDSVQYYQVRDQRLQENGG